MLDFTVISVEALRILKASPYSTARLLNVLVFLLLNRNIKTNCTRFLETPEIAEFCEISLRHTQRILKELVRLELIKCFQDRHGVKMWYLTYLELPSIAKIKGETLEAVQAEVNRLHQEYENQWKKESIPCEHSRIR